MGNHLSVYVQFEHKTDLKREIQKIQNNLQKGIKMLCNCIPKSDYDKLSEANGNDLQCENEHCTSCLIEELKKQKWQYSKEDNKGIKTILTLCHLEEYNLWCKEVHVRFNRSQRP